MSPWEGEEARKEKETGTQETTKVKKRENPARKRKQQFEDVNYARPARGGRMRLPLRP